MEVNVEVKMGEWDKYFMGLLGGKGTKDEVKVRGGRRGEDGIQNVSWIWRRRGLREALGEICRRVLWGEGFPKR